MNKPKTTKSETPFERFQALTKALVAVPRKEVQEKVEKHQAKKQKLKHTS